MRRFEVPEGWVAQAYKFALDPTPTQGRELAAHAGAARFAFNHMLAHVKAVMGQRAAAIADVVIEPRVGGRWFERGVDGSECDWGRVSVWEPPGLVILLWQIGVDWRMHPDFETEVELRFTDDGPGRTRLDLAHRHLERYGEAAEGMRSVFDSPEGWAGILTRFAELATNSATGKS
ncbi:MAG: helix-turn-helix domain-containing protein [Streptosporangiaceae bacterium]